MITADLEQPVTSNDYRALAPRPSAFGPTSELRYQRAHPCGTSETEVFGAQDRTADFARFAELIDSLRSPMLGLVHGAMAETGESGYVAARR